MEKSLNELFEKKYKCIEFQFYSINNNGNKRGCLL